MYRGALLILIYITFAQISREPLEVSVIGEFHLKINQKC